MDEGRVGRAVLLALVVFGACGKPADFDDLKKGQKEILAKIVAVETAAKQVRVPPAPTPVLPMDPNKIYAIPLSGSPVRGPHGAPVTIVEFSDFQCPFCAQSTDLVAQVLAAYPTDVNFVYKQYPLPATMHPNALAASRAAVAAQRQGKFWEMYEVLFKNQHDLGADKLKEYAARIGLDVARWERDVASSDVQAQIDAEQKEGVAADVRGTPTFFVAGKRVMNRSLDGMKQMIDAALKRG